MGSGTKTQGVGMCNQPRTVDLISRRGKFIELAPEFVIDEALARVRVIVD